MSCSNTCKARGREMVAGTRAAHLCVLPDPREVSEVRRFVRTQLAGQLAGTIDDACLLTSELVTNAFVHAGSSVVVGVAVDDLEILVTVSDGAHDRVPQVGRMPAAGDVVEMSRGVALVCAIAADFGWRLVPDESSKVVWFSLGATAPVGTG